jgi:MFS family permease
LVIPAVIAIGYAMTTEFDETAAVSVDGGTEQSKSMSVSEFVGSSRALFTAGFALAMVIVMMNGLFYRGMLTFLPEVFDQFLPPVTDFVQLFEPGSPMAEEFTLSSYLYVGLLTIGIAGQYVGGKVSDKISSTTGLAVVFGSLVAVTIAFVPAARGGVTTLLIVSALLGFLLFALQPLYQATIADHSPPDGRGLSYGYTYLTSFGVGATGAAIAGYLLSVTSVDGTFLALAAFPALGCLFALVLRRRGSKQAAEA